MSHIWTTQWRHVQSQHLLSRTRHLAVLQQRDVTTEHRANLASAFKSLYLPLPAKIVTSVFRDMHEELQHAFAEQDSGDKLFDQLMDADRKRRARDARAGPADGTAGERKATGSNGAGDAAQRQRAVEERAVTGQRASKLSVSLLKAMDPAEVARVSMPAAACVASFAAQLSAEDRMEALRFLVSRPRLARMLSELLPAAVIDAREREAVI
jgi:hypothetical protein